jgi:hypothetical protein
MTGNSKSVHQAAANLVADFTYTPYLTAEVPAAAQAIASTVRQGISEVANWIFG